MTILEVEAEPVESALQKRLRQIPADKREAVTGSYRPVLGRSIFAYDISSSRDVRGGHRKHPLIKGPS